MSRILVVGGTGWVGRAVVRSLSTAGEDVGLTWRDNGALASELPGRKWRCDLGERGAVAALWRGMEAEGWLPDSVVHCARACGAGEDAAIGEDDAEAAWRIHGGAALQIARDMAARPVVGTRHLLLLGALSPGQSFPMAPHLAAAHGALPALAMALGHQLGPAGFRVNVLALGLLDGGAAAAVTPEVLASYLRFAALRRVGTAEEVAATVRWLLRENTAINGKVISANGGI